MSLLLRRRMLLAQQSKSKNLCDVDYFMNNYTSVEVTTYSVVKLFVGTGNKVTVSISDKLPLGLGFYLVISYEPFHNSAYISWLYHNTSEVLCRKSVTFTSTQDYIYINVLKVDKFKENVGYLQVELNDHATEYEPYY